MSEINYRKILADNIRNYRANNKISRFKLSVALDLDNATLSAIENEQANVRINTVEKIASYMGLTIAEMFTENYVKSDSENL